MPWQGVEANYCNGEPQIGAPCDDGNPNTENDRIQADCTCGCPVVATTQIDTMLCMGDTLRFAGEVITTESGRYELVLPTNLGGCDSLQVTWFVEVIGSETIMEQDTICEGTVLDWRGLDLRESGTYEFTETTVSGNCDTLFQLDLLVLTRSNFSVADDAFELLSSNNPVELNVLSNDTLPFVYALDIIDLPTKGTVAVTEGAVAFTTDGVSSGRDSFRYEVCLGRCADFCQEAWVTLDIEFDCELEVMANTPSGFTPNGDGKNDLFDPLGGITGECLEQLGEARLGIRNRQSELVFSTEGTYQPWDGTSRKGERLPRGTYFYILEFSGLEEPVAGAVELER